MALESSTLQNKKKWQEIITPLLNSINSHTEPAHKKQKTIHIKSDYSVTYKNCDQFVQNLCTSVKVNSYDDTYQLRNNQTNIPNTIPHNSQITIGMLAKHFKQGGHPLGLYLPSSYKVNLMLDLDCKKCKTNEEHQPISMTYVYDLYDEISTIISQILDCDSVPNGVVFKKSNACNLHIYYNYTVSLILYQTIRHRIISELDINYLEYYTLDDITILDLPYSTKDGINIYEPVAHHTNKDYLNFNVSPAKMYFDVPVNVQSTPELSLEIELGSFKRKKQIIPYNEWSDDEVTLYYLTTPITPKIIRTDATNNIVKNLKLSNTTLDNPSYLLLSMYINNSPLLTDTIIADDAILSNIEDTPYNKTVQTSILQLCEKIATITYCEKSMENNQDIRLSYLLRFVTFDNCNYCFYSIMSIIRYIENKVQYTYPRADFNLHKVAVLDILQATVGKNYTSVNLQILLHTIDCIRNFNISTKLCAVFDNPQEWFGELTKLIHIDGRSPLDYIKQNVGIYNTAEEVVNLLCNYCSLICPLLHQQMDSKIYFIYANGLYLELKESDLIGHNILRVEGAHSKMRSLISDLVNSGQIDSTLIDKLGVGLYKTAWLQYIEKLSIKKPTFNMYSYFIATTQGIFNTIVGIYMKPISLIYMTTEKVYCTTPLNNTKRLEFHVRNNLLLSNYDSYKTLMNLVTIHQRQLFHLSVVVPGLLTLDNHIIQPNEEVQILTMLEEAILNCNNTNDMRALYYTLPLFVKYRIDLDVTIYIMRLLKTMYHEEHTYGITSILRVNAVAGDGGFRKIRDFNYTEETFTNTTTFVTELMMCYGKDIHLKHFVLALYLQIIDIAKDTHQFRIFAQNESPPTYPPMATVDNFLIHPFNYELYSTEHRANFIRALKIILPAEVFNICNDGCINIFMAYSKMFKYDPIVFKDFFNNLSMIYNPSNERKKLMLLIGSPGCGKTTLQNVLTAMHHTSHFNVTSIMQGNVASSSPSPDMVQIYGAYLFNIIEMHMISSHVLKALTGGDIIHKRNLYQNEFKQLKPLAFVIAAANDIPFVRMADEAIRTRLAPFIMDVAFIDSMDAYEDNPLLMAINKVILRPESFNTDTMGVDMSNLLYSRYCLDRNTSGLSIPVVQPENRMSNTLIMDILCKNNYIYELMKQSNIIFGRQRYIATSTLEEVMEVAITNYNHTHSSKGKALVTWSSIQRIMKTLFLEYLTSTGEGFNGFGLATNDSNHQHNLGDVLNILVPDIGNTVKDVTIKKHLNAKFNMSQQQINKTLQELILKHSPQYNRQFKLFQNLKIE
ncbi:helicase [Crangon crangon nudivirus]|uniref:Helicase n=1 Tax=Crangon crangon nudivirus TaxID=2880838 RepID=A0AAE8Y158_9VIRU|nr:helicase [Crangon crangon nudivirus]UBZ25578.1 helicase [Crangon crangon nudivirus]